jgi:glycosyltransferase involved in cell wall biosynthesis
MGKDILIVTYYFASPKNSNNRSNYIPQLMIDNGYSVELVCSNFDHKAKKHVQNEADATQYKVTLINVPGYKKNISIRRYISQKVFSNKLKEYLKKRKKPDAIYIFIPYLGVADVVRKYAKKNGVKLIIDVRDLWPEAFKMVFKIPILNDIVFLPFTIMANRVYKSADEIIAVSDTYRNRALKVNKKVKSAHTIYLGTELKAFDEFARASTENIIDKSDILLAYVGTLGHSYDIETVFDALSILKTRGHNNIKLLVMGSGPLETKFKNYAKMYEINVEFAGRLSYSEMVPRLNSCDIALNPITKGAAQSIINKHADYAAAGLPVVNTQECQEYRKLVEDFNIGLNARNSDAKDMADKIELLINNEGTRKKMGTNHRRLAEERFDRERTYKKIIELL